MYLVPLKYMFVGMTESLITYILLAIPSDDIYFHF